MKRIIGLILCIVFFVAGLYVGTNYDIKFMVRNKSLSAGCYNVTKIVNNQNGNDITSTATEKENMFLQITDKKITFYKYGTYPETIEANYTISKSNITDDNEILSFKYVSAKQIVCTVSTNDITFSICNVGTGTYSIATVLNSSGDDITSTITDKDSISLVVTANKISFVKTGTYPETIEANYTFANGIITDDAELVKYKFVSNTKIICEVNSQTITFTK